MSGKRKSLLWSKGEWLTRIKVLCFQAKALAEPLVGGENFENIKPNRISWFGKFRQRSRVNSLGSATSLGQRRGGCLREVVAYGKNQQTKPT